MRLKNLLYINASKKLSKQMHTHPVIKCSVLTSSLLFLQGYNLHFQNF